MRKMKDSGVAWIGEIPEEWETTKIKHHYHVILGKMLSPKQTNLCETLENYLCAQNITENRINIADVRQMWISPSESKQYLLNIGDVIVVEGGNVGLSCIYGGEVAPCYIQNALHRVFPKNNFCNKFLLYWMKFVEKSNYIQQITNRATISHYTKEKLENTPFVNISVDEQRRIADYLDAKCAEIDRSMELVREGIDKLKEYKKSVITQAVTKGLAPDVPMKDSGVPWIGQIPVTWKCLPLKRLVTNVKTGSTPKGAEEKYYAENGLKWFTPADFTTFPYLKDSVKKLSALGEKEVKIFPKDSILLIGIGATMGKVALSRCQCSANQQINCIQCKNDLLPLFLTFYLSTISDYLFKCGKFTTLPILNQEETKNIYIPCPPVPEQRRITSYLEAKCAEIDALITQKQALLDKLAEYKKSLIFECVTGKREVAA